MADEAPLLISSAAACGQSCVESTTDETPKHPNGVLPSIDEAIESYIGDAGTTNILPAVLATLVLVFDAQQTFINVFTDAMPPWFLKNSSSASAAAGGDSPCGLPPSTWSWSLPIHSSTISEWSLECASPAVLGLPSSSYFSGCLAGGFLFATLADSHLGRKKMLLLSTLSMSISAALTAASPSLPTYAALRFVAGLFRSTVGTSVIVLSTELVSRRWRDRISIVGFSCFTLGFLSLPAMAYVSRGNSWRVLYLMISLPSFLYTILIYFFIEESPRWLLLRGRRSEAIEIIKRIAGSNINDSSISKLKLAADAREKDELSTDIFVAAKMLWGNRWAFRRLTAVMTVSFGVGMVYYGMPLNLGNLSSDLYLSVALNAITELPSSLIIFFLVGRMNRRSSTLAFTAASGLFSLVCSAISGGGKAQMAAELVAFFAACTAFGLVLIFSIELFPTCVRNSAIAMVRQAVVLGGAVAPVLVAAGRGSRMLSFGVFGLVIGCCGVFAVCLPETRGRGICDTMEEEECRDSAAKFAIEEGR
ncbi:hypothetical protein HPP92_012063 [Vanilla planifolia]|uniref:H(+)/Pi cotransporter n=1 Tax=Vanilla planifolia TaxID=51239 RepID=A0A835R3Y8_VANPL|nr:hypothetical protein HPP92_012433 [Vanilla planifolia]KAG0483979.1 hypothetical protein HPP92_012063 [Vanilla planifolia]